MSVGPLIWPPLPEDGQPFAPGEMWRVEKRDGWMVEDDIDVGCESVRAWTSGDTEITLSAHRHVEPPQVPITGPHRPVVGIPEFWQEFEWTLAGNPPGVKQATKRQRSEIRGQTRTEEQSVSLVSGHLPVRP